MLRDFAKEFFEFVDNSRLENGSKRDYRRGWKLLKGSKLAGMRLDQITRDDCETTRFYVLPPRRKDSTRQRVPYESPYSTNCAIRTLSRMLHKAKDWKYLSEIPRLKTVEAPARTAMFTAEVEAMVLEACPQPMRDVLILVLDMGLRNGSEAVCMRWEYLNLTEGYYFNPKGKTENARRVVGLSERVLKALRGRKPQFQGWIFPSEKSKSGHIELPKLQAKFRRICRRMGLPDELKMYCGRHRFGTTMMDQTGDPSLVMKAMGHGDIRSTLGYLRPNVGKVKSVIDNKNRENEAALAAKAQQAATADETKGWVN